MAFMMILLVAILCVTVWAYFHTSPRGRAGRRLTLYNLGVLVIALAAASVVGPWIHAEALNVKRGIAGLPVYLSVMAGGTVFMIVLVLGGMTRNFFLFPGASAGDGGHGRAPGAG